MNFLGVKSFPFGRKYYYFEDKKLEIWYSVFFNVEQHNIIFPPLS